MVVQTTGDVIGYVVSVVVAQVPIYAAYMVVVPVYGFKKEETVRTGLVFVLDDVNQATAMQDEVLVAKMVVEINELQLVAISFDLDTTVGTNEKVAP